MTTTSSKPSQIANPDFLIRGSDYVGSIPDFSLVGRDNDLKELSIALMRKENNNVVVYGPNGVGTSAVIMGLQASKDLPNTPFDIVGKRFFWLDTDGLFASGDAAKINEGFQKAIGTLSRTPDSVLVMDDVKDFLDGCRNNGTMNLINALMREIRNGRFQVVMEARDENLADLFKAHSDIGQIFTFKEIEQPSDKATLKKIVQSTIGRFEEHHGISVSQEAIDQVVDLTWKYPGLTLNVAQPKRSLMILEGAMTAFRYKAHTRPLELDELEPRLAALDEVLKGKPTSNPEFQGKAPQELEALRLETQNQIRDVNDAWNERQAKIRKAYGELRDGEEHIRQLDEDIAVQKEKEAFTSKLVEEYKKTDDVEKRAKIQEQYFHKYGETLKIAEDVEASTGFRNRLNKTGIASTAVEKLLQEKQQVEALVAEQKGKFREMTRGSEMLTLGADLVLGEFSKISRIPMNKLQQDETAKLLNLEGTLKERVFGQDEPVVEVAKAVRRGRTGLKKPNKPIGSFLFLGPSGVGKTELAKALAAALFGDEAALETYNMSEYMEKHAVSTLIGAPPGYDGYEAGGVLTNNMRRRPYCVNVFDEAEKADKQVFDIFLQILDEGKVKDRRGVESSFANAINILTSNIGAQHFLNEEILPAERLEQIKAAALKAAGGDEKEAKKLYEEQKRAESFEEAKKLALKDLWDPSVGGFRPEFLNRFTGIFCFNSLGQPEIILIAGKALKELNNWVAEKGIKVSMAREELEEMCADQYVPRAGGRGIMNYIERNVTNDVAETLLKHPDKPGIVTVTYDGAKKATISDFVSQEQANQLVTAANANQQATPAAGASAKAAFKPVK